MDNSTIITLIGWVCLVSMIMYTVVKNVRLPTKLKKTQIAFWIPISVMIIITILIPFINSMNIFGKLDLMELFGKYFSHLWLYAIIYGYSSSIHYLSPGYIASLVNIGITILFSLGVLVLAMNMESSMLEPFQYIYKLFDYLILSKHLSIFNVIILGICSGVVYYLYTNARYIKDGDKEQCDWHKTAFSLKTKIVILTFVCVFVLYPLLLCWRSYSLENTDLVHTKIPLFLFAISMFVVFHNLFITGWFSSRKSESLAKDETDNNITKKQCDDVARNDYFSSAGFNYIIWMCVGLMCHSVRMTWSKNTAIQNRGVATIGDAGLYFLNNLKLIMGHCLGTIFGGANLWRS